MCSCSFLYAKEGEEGIVIIIQDEEEHTIEGEGLRILDEQGHVVGRYTSDGKGMVELPFLKVGDYHIELNDRKGYVPKKSIPFTVTEYNQLGTMEMTIVMNQQFKVQTKDDSSMLQLFLLLFNGCTYLFIYGWYKGSFKELLEVGL